MVPKTFLLVGLLVAVVAFLQGECAVQIGNSFPNGVLVNVSEPVSCTSETEGLLWYDPVSKTLQLCRGDLETNETAWSGPCADTSQSMLLTLLSEVQKLRDPITFTAMATRVNVGLFVAGENNFGEDHCECYNSASQGFFIGARCQHCQAEYIRDSQDRCTVYDPDDDGVGADVDNCLEVYNPDQLDNNDNGIGDACEDFASCAEALSVSGGASGIYILNGEPGYCYNEIAGGGWTFVAEIVDDGNVDWSYFSSSWSDSSVEHFSPKAGIVNSHTDPFSSTGSRKYDAYKNTAINEVLFMTRDGEHHYAMSNLYGVHHGYTSMQALMASSDVRIFGETTLSKSGVDASNTTHTIMWDSNNWALKNVEDVDDECENSRIATCKQVHVGHTGGGGIAGMGCTEHANSRSRTFLWSGDYTPFTYACLTSGHEPRNYPVDDTVTELLMFVRYTPVTMYSSCTEALAANGDASGIYHLNITGSPSQVNGEETYCESRFGGDWTHAFTMVNDGQVDWGYYTGAWDTAVPSASSANRVLSPFDEPKSLKSSSYSGNPFNEVLFMSGSDQSKYYVMTNLLGQQKSFSSFQAMMADVTLCSPQTHIWGERLDGSSQHSMWTSPYWAFKNMQADSDQCRNGRIAACRQTRVGHTGAGEFAGIGCGGNTQQRTFLWNDPSPTTTTHRCVDFGNEPADFPLDQIDSLVVFVRQRDLSIYPNCSAALLANGNADGTYTITNDGTVTPYTVYCEGSLAGGGWTHVASITNDGADWSYFSSLWNTANTHRSVNGDDPFAGGKTSKKTEAYNTVPFTEAMFVTYDRSKYYAFGNLYGSGASFTSVLSMMSGSSKRIWGEKIASAGYDGSSQTSMWDSPNWAFRNDEDVGDQCWSSRVAVCKQVHVGHTGGGSFIGTQCNGGSSNTYNFMWQSGGTTVTYRCLTSGSEPFDLPIDTSVDYMAMFVRVNKFPLHMRDLAKGNYTLETVEMEEVKVNLCALYKWENIENP